MNSATLESISHNLIKYSFYALFILVPLILTPWNYELFEYNKMMTTYVLTIAIVALWLARMILAGQVILVKTPLDIPIALYLASQVISTFLSIDPHVSWWGYYSRFHGGLLSTITYILLYYAFASNFALISNFKFQISNFLKVALFSGFLVSIYAILEHYGSDKHLWVQDVQNRVFSTLGQPNWLAAYLAILIPISLSIGSSYLYRWKENSSLKIQNSLVFLLVFISLIFYTALLFTKSRSGFVAIWISVLFFLLLQVITRRRYTIIATLIAIALYLGATIVFRSPYDQINRYLPSLPKLTILRLISGQTYNPSTSLRTSVGPALETGGTESWEIRQIVWRGAWEIARRYPIVGSGVETFAFAYYQVRPAKHNLTSEWDFLYNKAHNEFLNHLATTGFIGLSTYLLLIVGFGWWFFQRLNHESRIMNYGIIKTPSRPMIHNSYFMIHGLFAGWLSIHFTNAVGFSVVPVAVWFWLIPAMSFVASHDARPFVLQLSFSFKKRKSMGVRLVSLLLVAITSTSFIVVLARFWIADTHFATGLALSKAGYFTEAYTELRQAISLNDLEPLYHDEFANVLAPLAILAVEAKEATLAAELQGASIRESDIALAISPNNVSFWKSRTRLFHTLADIDEKFVSEALKAIEKAEQLAPTDAKIVYNKALLQNRLGSKEQAIATLKQAISLKPNYREPHFALAVFYDEMNKKAQAKESLETILTTINPNDEEAKKMLEEL